MCRRSEQKFKSCPVTRTDFRKDDPASGPSTGVARVVVIHDMIDATADSVAPHRIASQS